MFSLISMSQSQLRRGTEVSLTWRVVEAVAEREGVDPVELKPPLRSALDPDALETLFDHSGSEALRLEFSYCGYDVAVEENSVELLNG